MSMTELEELVQNYLDKLEWQHPPQRSDKFIANSMGKWACKELRRDIHMSISGELPFHLTPAELLENFIDRMNRYACEIGNKNARYRFSIAADTGEYFMEEYWQRAAK